MTIIHNVSYKHNTIMYMREVRVVADKIVNALEC